MGAGRQRSGGGAAVMEERGGGGRKRRRRGWRREEEHWGEEEQEAVRGGRGLWGGHSEHQQQHSKERSEGGQEEESWGEPGHSPAKARQPCERQEREDCRRGPGQRERPDFVQVTKIFAHMRCTVISWCVACCLRHCNSIADLVLVEIYDS